MEPGHEDREYISSIIGRRRPGRRPQWSPVMKTGNTWPSSSASWRPTPPQWSPVMKTGNTRDVGSRVKAMEGPQWSPVMKTGNTSCSARTRYPQPSLNGARS